MSAQDRAALVARLRIALAGGETVGRVLLAGPCVFCGYNGCEYWQSGRHAASCPWREVGGEFDRLKALPQAIAALATPPAEREAEQPPCAPACADDVCLASKQDGVLCADDECDYHSGARKPPAHAPAEPPQTRCDGCGYQWPGPWPPAHLCGDCWRKAQPVLHAPAPEREAVRVLEELQREVHKRIIESPTRQGRGALAGIQVVIVDALAALRAEAQP